MSLFTTTAAVKDVAKLQPVIHGTYRRVLDSIMEQGLTPSAMRDSDEFHSEKGRTRSRAAVHFMAQGLKEKENLKLSTIRREADAFIIFDLEQ